MIARSNGQASTTVTMLWAVMARVSVSIRSASQHPMMTVCMSTHCKERRVRGERYVMRPWRAGDVLPTTRFFVADVTDGALKAMNKLDGRLVGSGRVRGCVGVGAGGRRVGVRLAVAMAAA